MKLDLNRKFAIVAVVLGFLAIFGGNPQTESKTVVDTNSFISEIVNGENNICVKDLAEWIIKQKADFRLIDIRTEEQFNEYHIPLAENINISYFNEIDMPRNEKYIIISDSDILEGQAWSLLKTRDYPSVYMIKGGIDSWKNNILFPKLSLNATPEEINEFEKIKEISKFFGGNPQEGVSTEALDQKIEMPKLQMPVQVQVQKKKKLKKEGC